MDSNISHTSSVTPATASDGDGGDAGLDVDALLAGVHRRHRASQRRRLVGSGLGAVMVAALAAGLVIGGGATPSPEQGTGESAADESGVVALSPYTMAANRQATPVATVDGLELTYLPPNLPAEPTIETGATAAEQPEDYTVACFGGEQCQGSLGVIVTRRAGLDLAGYQETHYVGEDATETTVGDRPALATNVDVDGATGLVWSPQPGVVIEINIDSGREAELRQIVDGARFTG